MKVKKASFVRNLICQAYIYVACQVKVITIFGFSGSYKKEYCWRVKINNNISMETIIFCHKNCRNVEFENHLPINTH